MSSIQKLCSAGVALLLILSVVSIASAQEEDTETPRVAVDDQALGDDATVTVREVVAAAPSWIVIHRELAGAPGPVIGITAVPAGVSNDVVVTLDQEPPAGTRLFAILHADEGEEGVYEFPGADDPISVDGGILSESFIIQAAAEMEESAEEVEAAAAESEETTEEEAAAEDAAGEEDTAEEVLDEEIAEEAVDEEVATGEEVQQLQNIPTIVLANSDFSVLEAALDEAGLTSVLQGEGPFTVFAPTNDAFSALSVEALDDLLADENALRAVLLFHVVPERLPAADLSDGQALETAQGSELTVSVSDAGVMVNGANVIVPDVEAANGVIHVLDQVLLPPGVDMAAAGEEAAEEAVEEVAPAPAEEEAAEAVEEATPTEEEAVAEQEIAAPAVMPVTGGNFSNSNASSTMGVVILLLVALASVEFVRRR